MKKLILFSIAAITIAVACKKELLNKKTHYPANSSHNYKTFDPSNPNNEFDDIGIIHNNMARFIMEHQNFDSSDFVGILTIGNEWSMNEYNEEFFDEEGTNNITDIFDLYMDDGKVDTSYLLQVEVPKIEIDMLREFLSVAYNLGGNPVTKINRIKEIEITLVRDKNQYSTASYERLSIMFSIYRYSTYLWEMEYSDKPHLGPWASYFDAIVNYICIQSGGLGDWYAADAWECSQVAGLFSLCMAFL
jgi:hypothetical protein